MSKLLILFVILVRDQEVGGSNPLAPTNLFNHFQPTNKDIRVQKGSVFGPYSDPGAGLYLSIPPCFDPLAVRRPLGSVPGGLAMHGTIFRSSATVKHRTCLVQQRVL
jgi:hypothetical protein